MLCAIAYLLVSVPTGWLADRLNRKVCNFIGDVLYGASLIMLALSTSFTDVTIAGVIMALGNATTLGADEALFKAHCDELKKNYDKTSKRVSQMGIWVGVVHQIGGGVLISLFGLRTTLLITSVPFFVAAVLGIFILEIGEHKEKEVAPDTTLATKISGELKGMVGVIWYALFKNQKLAWLLGAYAVGATMGGPIMVFIGPMILAIGKSESDIGIAYVIVSAAAWCGGWLSQRILPDPFWSVNTADPANTPLDAAEEESSIKTWPLSGIFLIGGVASFAAMAIASINLTLATVVLHIVVVHTMRRWISITIYPLVHRAAPANILATVSSLMSSVSIVLYMGVVIVINFAGNLGVRWGIATNAILFLPLVVIVALKLRQQEKDASTA